MPDLDLRRWQRALAADPHDAELLRNYLSALQRAGRKVPLHLWRRRRLPARTFQAPVCLGVVAIDHEVERTVGWTPAEEPLQIPECQRWYVETRPRGREDLEAAVEVVRRQHVPGLSVVCDRLSSSDLEALAGVGDLEELRLIGLEGQHWVVSGRVMEGLPVLPRLLRLHVVCGMSWTARSLQRLTAFTGLTELALNWLPGRMGEGLAGFVEATGLRGLHLEYSDLPLETFADLDGLEALSTSCTTGESTQPLQRLRGLRWLDLSLKHEDDTDDTFYETGEFVEPRFSRGQLEGLEGLPLLEDLRLDAELEDEDAARFVAGLGVDRLSVTLDGPPELRRALHRARGLHAVKAWDARLGREDLEQLAEQPALRSLEAYDLLPGCASALRGLTGLRRLWVALETRDFDSLEGLDTLNTVGVALRGGATPSARALSALGRLRGLRSLSLVGQQQHGRAQIEGGVWCGLEGSPVRALSLNEALSHMVSVESGLKRLRNVQACTWSVGWSDQTPRVSRASQAKTARSLLLGMPQLRQVTLRGGMDLTPTQIDKLCAATPNHCDLRLV